MSADNLLYSSINGSLISVSNSGRSFRYIKYEDYDIDRHEWGDHPTDKDDPYFYLVDQQTNMLYDAIIMEDGTVMDMDCLFDDIHVFEDFRIDPFPEFVADIVGGDFKIRVNSRGMFFSQNEILDPPTISRIDDLASYLIGFV